MKKIFLVALVLSFVLPLGLPSQEAFAALATCSPLATQNRKYTTDEIDCLLRDGVRQAWWWDTRPYNSAGYTNGEWQSARAVVGQFAPSFTFGTNPSLRDVMNCRGTPVYCASYAEETWLSASTRGNAANPVNVAYGSTSVALRMNSVEMLTGTLVTPDRSNEAGLTGAKLAGEIAANNTKIAEKDNRWVQYSTTTGGIIDAKDRSPNAVGSSGMKPAKLKVRTLVLSMTPKYMGGAWNGSSAGTMSPSALPELSLQRSEFSRYWFAMPTPVTLTMAHPVEVFTTIDVDVTYKTISTYHSLTGDETCSGATVRQRMPWAACNTLKTTMRLTIQPGAKPVPLTWAVNGETKVNSNKVPAGKPIVWGHSLNKNGNGSGTVTWSIMRRVGGGAWGITKIGSTETGSANPNKFLISEPDTYTPTAAEAGRDICEKISFTPANSSNATSVGESTEQCATVVVDSGSTPLVQVWGNDVRVGSTVLGTGNVGARIQASLIDHTSLGVVDSPQVVAIPAPQPGVCTPWNADLRSVVSSAGGLVDTLKLYYGAPVMIASSYYNSSQPITARYIPPTSYTPDTVPFSPTAYAVNSCIDANTAFVDATGHLVPTKLAQWRALAFAAPNTGANVHAATMRTDNSLQANLFASNLSVAQPTNAFYLFHNKLIDPYDGLDESWLSYQLWGSGPADATQAEQAGYMTSLSPTSMNTLGSTVFSQTIQVKKNVYDQMKTVDPKNQTATGLILMTMLIDDFGTAFLNGHHLTGDVVGLPPGDTVTRGGRFVAVAVDPAWFNPPDANGDSSNNILTVFDLDKRRENHLKGQTSGVGIGTMYSMIYMPPKVPPEQTGADGSWGEYSALAPIGAQPTASSVNSFASGAGLVNGNPSNLQSSWSKLTFANTKSPVFGNYTTSADMGTIPDIGRYLTKSGLRGIQQHTVSGNVMIRDGSPDSDLNPAILTKGSHVLYNPSGSVTIKSNLQYAGGATTPGTMSQLVIVAQNIYIDSDVTRVDAWLIAPNGVINTCALFGGQSPTTDGKCSALLTINGAMTAKQILLMRSRIPTDTEPHRPAEILNLRGDAYIWARHVSEENGNWVTRALTEQSPRY